MLDFPENDLIAKLLTDEQQSLLKEAFAVFEGVDVTGFLSDALVYRACASGLVFAHDQFRNGHQIRTSTIIQAWRVGSFMAIQTLNSVYVIASWSDDHPRHSLDKAGLVRPNLEGFPGAILH